MSLQTTESNRASSANPSATGDRPLRGPPPGNERSALLQKLRSSRRREEVESFIGQLGELTSVKEASMAVSAWGRVRDWKRALEVLSEMRERGLQPNVITYSAAISACEKGSRWERALELLEEMKQRGVEPDVITYNAAISACEM